MTIDYLAEVTIRSNSHAAPPKVTITRPSSVAAVSVGARKSSEVISAIGTQLHKQLHDKNKKKLACSAPAATRLSTSRFAAPTRLVPPPVRPKSSSVATPSKSTTTLHFTSASPRSGGILSPRKQEVRPETTKPLVTTMGVSKIPQPSTQLSSSSADATGSIYHVMAARKNAEDIAKQLARRITHFRTQEERVLHEVQDVKNKLESDLLVAQHQHQNAQHALLSEGEHSEWPAIDYPKHHRPIQGWVQATNKHRSGASIQAMQSRKEPKAPRSREQLQFLTLALEKQKLKEADKHSKIVQKDKIRQEYQRALDVRVAKQHQLLESLEKQHDERLQIEKEREHRALDLIEQLREEEKHVALRLQALKFHQEFVKSST